MSFWSEAGENASKSRNFWSQVCDVINDLNNFLINFFHCEINLVFRYFCRSIEVLFILSLLAKITNI